jgi:hypothetical protein
MIQFTHQFSGKLNMSAFEIIKNIDDFLNHTGGTAFVAFVDMGKQKSSITNDEIYIKIQEMSESKKMCSKALSNLSIKNIKLVNTQSVEDQVLAEIMGRPYDSVLMVVNQYRFVDLYCMKNELNLCQSKI